MKQTFWAGFCEGKLFIDLIDDGFGGYGIKKRQSPALFLSYKAARHEFEDVRKVVVTISGSDAA